MANESQRYPSRLNKKNRSNSILNMMIGLVFTLILIVGAFIFLGGDDGDKEQANESVTVANGTEDETSDDGGDNGGSSGNGAAAGDKKEENDPETDESNNENDDGTDNGEEEEGSVTIEGSVTYEESSDPIVKETVINTGWKPIGTEQTGEHVSVYDQSSVDWQEKIDAISYATGLGQDNMFIMMIQNGGGPQKSIGTVTSKDKEEKYRVYLEWVDGEGWKPIKMDILNTIEGAY
ncbi:DUF1510 family protein [Planomicrobium sp. YIM 101495]|nr:DUF1510 family protein [Planomicrobium sp. YIM 101495]